MEEQDAVKIEMGRRMVVDMDPEDAKIVLLDVISGTELYTAILAAGQEKSEIPAKKKRKKWTRKATPMQNVPPMPQMPSSIPNDPPF